MSKTFSTKVPGPWRVAVMMEQEEENISIGQQWEVGDDGE